MRTAKSEEKKICPAHTLHTHRVGTPVRLESSTVRKQSSAAVRLHAPDEISTPVSPALPFLGGPSLLSLSQTEDESVVTPPTSPRSRRLQRQSAAVCVGMETAREVVEDRLKREEIDKLGLTRKQKIHAFFDAAGPGEEQFSRYHSRVTNSLMMISFGMIILSVVIFSVESLPEYYERELLAFYVLESMCVGWFSFELLVSLVTCPVKSDFFKSLFSWVDILAIIPYYVDLTITSLGGSSSSTKQLIVLRVVRLTRVFRVFKLSKYNEGVEVVFVTLWRSVDALSLLIFLTTLTIVLFGSAIYFAEQTAAEWDPQNETWVRTESFGGPETPHKFQSILYGCWWCLVTVTTVGYGDMYPVTFPGYVVGISAMFAGLLIVAFPIIIIGSKFTEVRTEFAHKKLAQIRLDKASNRRLSIPCASDELGFMNKPPSPVRGGADTDDSRRESGTVRLEESGGPSMVDSDEGGDRTSSMRICTERSMDAPTVRTMSVCSDIAMPVVKDEKQTLLSLLDRVDSMIKKMDDAASAAATAPSPTNRWKKMREDTAGARLRPFPINIDLQSQQRSPRSACSYPSPSKMEESPQVPIMRSPQQASPVLDAPPDGRAKKKKKKKSAFSSPTAADASSKQEPPPAEGTASTAPEAKKPPLPSEEEQKEKAKGDNTAEETKENEKEKDDSEKAGEQVEQRIVEVA